MPRLHCLTREEAVAALQNANKIDFFDKELYLDEINQKARSGLRYVPVDGPQIEYKGPELKYDVCLVWMFPSAEGGMPHTRAPNLICIPQHWPKEKIDETIRHELVHVDQRMRVEKWIHWCVQNGWNIIDKSEIPERWLRRCRLNPDTMMYRFWIYMNRWVPLPLYEREDKPHIRQVQIRWWDKRTGELLFDPPAEVKEHIQGVHNPEHPFEIAAYKEIQI